MRHSLESCLASALNYQTKTTWKNSDNPSYQAARHNGWSDQCCAHMVAGKAGPKFGQRTYTTEQWIEKAVAKHGDRYDYSKVKYSGSAVKVEIVCADHGAFTQAPFSHLLGIGCPECGLDKQAAARTGMKYDKPASNRSTLEHFIALAKAVHGSIYDYSKVEYHGRQTKVEIVCPEHGSFWQKAGGHLNGKGCAQCFAVGPSRAETEVFDFIKAHAPDAMQSVIGLLDGQHELDIVIPSLKVAIEFNGLIWHSSRYGKARNYHQCKSDQAKAAGYRLIHIWADEWRDKRAWCKAFLKMQLVGPDRKFYARKCEFKPVPAKAVGVFHETYHLQGMRGGVSIGAYSTDGELLAVATVQGDELVRWTVKFGVVIVGGLSKMMKLFGRPILSFCDTAKHTGGGYLAAGFKLVGVSEPSYHYTDGKNRHNRVGFQKHKLARKEGVVGNTEKELAASLGFYQIGGCKQLRFECNQC